MNNYGMLIHTPDEEITVIKKQHMRALRNLFCLRIAQLLRITAASDPHGYIVSGSISIRFYQGNKLVHLYWQRRPVMRVVQEHGLYTYRIIGEI